MGWTDKLYGTIPKRFPTPSNEANELDRDEVSTSSSIVSTASGGRYRLTPIPTGKGSKAKRNKLAKRMKTPKQLEEEIIEEAEDEAEEELQQEYDDISFASRTASEPVQIRDSPAQYAARPDPFYEESVLDQYYKHRDPPATDYESPVPAAETTPMPVQPRVHHRHRKHERDYQRDQHRHTHKTAEPAKESHPSRKHRRGQSASIEGRSACSCGSERIIHASNCGCHACNKLREGKRRSQKHGLSRKLERLHQAEEGARCHCADCKKKRYKAKLKKEIMQEIEMRKRQEVKHRHRHTSSRHRRYRDRYSDRDSRMEVQYVPVPIRRHRGHRTRGYQDGPVTRADLESLAYEMRRRRLSPRRHRHHRYR